MQEFVIHIGPHKTATTYIQAVLHALREDLLHNDVLFPIEWCLAQDQPSHRRLFDLVRNADATTVGEHIRRISSAHRGRVVISAEDLAALTEPEILTLKNAIGDVPARIVFYCRRPSELLSTCWQEHVKHGGFLTLPEYVAGQLLNAGKSRILNWRLVLDAYASVFGSRNVLLVSYSNAVDAGVDIAQQFLSDVLNLSHVRVPEAMVARMNASLDAAEVEIIRVLNSMHRSKGGGPSAGLRDWYTGRGRTLIPPFVGATMAAHIGWMSIDDRFPSLRELHREAFAAYGRALINPAGSGSLYAERTTHSRYIRTDYTTSFMVSEIIRHTYDDYCRSLLREVV